LAIIEALMIDSQNTAPASRNEFFDPEEFARVQGAFDDAWNALPSSRQTPQTKAALAKAVIHFAVEGESDPAQLSQRALGTIATATWHIFEVLEGHVVIATAPFFIETPDALWKKITELANFHAQGCRIRVTDQSGATVILVGVATALRLAAFPFKDS
jgi:hypothetical protein